MPKFKVRLRALMILVALSALVSAIVEVEWNWPPELPPRPPTGQLYYNPPTINSAPK